MDIEYLLDLLEGASADARTLERTRYQPGYGYEDLRSELAKRIRHVADAANFFIGGHGRLVLTAFENFRYGDVADYVDQATYHVENAGELQRALGPPPGPTLRADALHPTVWDACASLWRSNHRRAATNAAAVAVDAALQNRIGRRDLSGKRLWQESFGLSDPAPGRPRLRVHPSDGSETYTSMQEGAVSFGAGCFQAFRNVGAAHTLGEEPPEHEALEQLAAFSILARWVESAELVADE